MSPIAAHLCSFGADRSCHKPALLHDESPHDGRKLKVVQRSHDCTWLQLGLQPPVRLACLLTMHATGGSIMCSCSAAAVRFWPAGNMTTASSDETLIPRVGEGHRPLFSESQSADRARSPC